jgi:septal ring factor EnvC (AmiA/AmiB activator)
MGEADVTVSETDIEILEQIADGQIWFITDNLAARREQRVLDEIQKLVIEIANSHAVPGALEKALPRLANMLERLQAERAQTHSELEASEAAIASAKEELKARGYCECGRPVR